MLCLLFSGESNRGWEYEQASRWHHRLRGVRSCARRWLSASRRGRAKGTYVTVSRTQYEERIETHYRWNYRMIAAVEGIWGFGMALVSHVAILPVFLNILGASPFVIGLLPATFRLFLTVPQLLVARFTRALPLK